LPGIVAGSADPGHPFSERQEDGGLSDIVE
jgi:hypothetical protein